MKWFKHLVTASTSEKLNALMDKYPRNRVGAYGRYWLMLEMLAAKYDINALSNDNLTPTFNIHLDTIKQTLRIHRDIDCKMYVTSMHDVGLMSATLNERSCIITFPKLLEVMGKDEKHRRKKVAQLSLEEKRVDENRIEESRQEHSSLADFFSLAITLEPPVNFIDKFGQDTIDKNWNSNVLYYESKNMTKSFGQFMYESLDRTVKKFGSKKSDQEKLEELAKEMGL